MLQAESKGNEQRLGGSEGMAAEANNRSKQTQCVGIVMMHASGPPTSNVFNALSSYSTW